MSVAPAPVSRLSPCPCGSGKRFKDCHGALAAAAANARRSAYRPSGPEWNLLAETERDRLGLLMEAALVHQREGRAAEAARHYREVLAMAPRTHDALHMLGMARWSEGDYIEARRLIEEALALRPEYPAIRQNLSLVLSARSAHERSAQEALCEKALPRLFDLLRSPEGSSVTRAPAVPPQVDHASIHLIGADDGSDGDDAWMLRRLATLLAPVNPLVWSADLQGVGTGRELGATLPAGGVHVWVGVDAHVRTSFADSDPRRTLVLAQSGPPSRWLDGLRRIAADGARPLELVVDSQVKGARFGGGHHVLPIPIDLDEYSAAKRTVGSASSGEFVVGNVVQDGRAVAHARSSALQEQIATAGFRVDLYDPGRIRHALGAMRNVRCVSRRTVALAQFLAPLSCYVYCCDAWWKEGLGRELFGAMALGVPVLCPRTSIHAEHVRDGVDGILYDDDADALRSLAALRDDPRRRGVLGAAAAAAARRMFDADALAVAYRRLVTDA